MIYFGWGTKNKTWSFKSSGEEKRLVCKYKYISVMVIFKLIVKKEWYILSDKRSEDMKISIEQVKKLFPNKVPSLGWWESYGLLILIGLIWFIGMFGVFDK